MALLPEQLNALPISTTIEYISYPSFTWYSDPRTHRLTRMCDEREAVIQSIEEILAVDRFKWSIFTANHGMDYQRLIGSDFGYVAAELKRRVIDAFKPDDRVLAVEDFKVQQISSDALRCDFTVHTIYGQIEHYMEVGI